MARYFFGDRSAVGQRITMDAAGVGEYEVIGVVKDVHHYGVREQPCGGRVAYLAGDIAKPAGAFMVRGSVPLAELQRIVREEVKSFGNAVLLARMRPLDDDVADMVARERMVGILAIGFALLALTIAAVGVYGVLAYGVIQRTSEIGLRAALGAAPAALTRMILRDALLLVVLGLAIGLPVTLAFVRHAREPAVRGDADGHGDADDGGAAARGHRGDRGMDSGTARRRHRSDFGATRRVAVQVRMPIGAAARRRRGRRSRRCGRRSGRAPRPLRSGSC